MRFTCIGIFGHFDRQIEPATYKVYITPRCFERSIDKTAIIAKGLFTKNNFPQAPLHVCGTRVVEAIYKGTTKYHSADRELATGTGFIHTAMVVIMSFLGSQRIRMLTRGICRFDFSPP